MKIALIILSAFEFTGGIEKFNRALIKALDEISKIHKYSVHYYSVHDKLPDIRYTSKENFTGFNGNKIKFIFICLKELHRFDLVFVGHINLYLIALLIKIIKPAIKIILIGHGIEIWGKQKNLRKLFISLVNQLLVVSEYTKKQVLINNKLSNNRIIILNNTLDPYFIPKYETKKSENLLKKFNLSGNEKIILSLTRINQYEGYKGYDKVMEAMPIILKQFKNVKYLLAGKYTEKEKNRLILKARELNIEKNFILCGFIPESQIVDLYNLADVFVLPSKKEGFGIVFIEAAACGIPVIAGNKDGSVDATINGRLGMNIDPENILEIASKIIEMLTSPKYPNRNLVIEKFGFQVFIRKLENVLKNYE